MSPKEITLGIVAVGGIMLLGFFSPPIFSPEGKLLFVPPQTAQVSSGFASSEYQSSFMEESMVQSLPKECLDGASQKFSSNRKSVGRMVDSENYCSDIEVSTSLVDSNLSVVDRTVIYRTSVTNNGPHTAHAVHIKGNIPYNFSASKLSGDIETGSYLPHKDDYFIPTLGVGQTTFIDFSVDISSVSCGLIHDNTAFVETFAGFDYEIDNNVDKSRLAVPACPKWDKIYSL